MLDRAWAVFARFSVGVDTVSIALGFGADCLLGASDDSDACNLTGLHSFDQRMTGGR